MAPDPGKKQQQQLARVQKNQKQQLIYLQFCLLSAAKEKQEPGQKNNNQQSTYLANKWLDTSCLLLGCRGKQKKKKIKN